MRVPHPKDRRIELKIARDGKLHTCVLEMTFYSGFGNSYTEVTFTAPFMKSIAAGTIVRKMGKNRVFWHRRRDLPIDIESLIDLQLQEDQ